MNYVSPEKKGIASDNISKYIECLEKGRLSTHDLLLMRGNDIFFEGYWKPFDKDFMHRMYSVSKSFVALAVGFLQQDGLISLDDKIEKYFPDELKNQKDENMRNQTIRNMLMMSTAKTGGSWFDAKPNDRVRYYFENDKDESRPAGTIFRYDSTGSFVLGALVERLTKMTFMDYLRIKMFDKIGVSKEAYCLKCPGGHSWGDSAVICTPMDLMRVARFTLNGGSWNGEQILDRDFVRDATSKLIDNNVLGTEDLSTQGYGYLIWMTYQNSFFFNGMGCQFAVCVPQKDIIMVYNGDNQGKDYAKKLIIDNFFEYIVNRAQDCELPENPTDQKKLSETVENLKLAAAIGEKHSEWEDKLNGAEYIMNSNPMGITRMKFSFEGEKGRLEYTNGQGDKCIEFGMCENAFGLFPQEGYSDEIGTVATKNFYYKCAASAAWVSENQLFIKVQIIDKYFGNLNINLGFKEDKIGVYMNKSAEDFLSEYQGFAGGVCKR